MAGKQHVVHGDDMLYRFFKELTENDPHEGEALAFSLVEATAIWWPLDLYRDWPILLPWVVRDPSCRGNPKRGVPDQWASPDGGGFLRDDNSLVKSLPRSLSIRGPADGHLHGAKMGREFVASHVWRVVDHEALASRLPSLNSFIPNLVWLPTQVSKLSDREGSPVQRALQSMAWSIYRRASVAPELRETVEESWRLLPSSVEVSVDVTRLHWFDVTDKFIQTRRAKLKVVVEALRTLRDGGELEKKVIATRYTEGLPNVSAEARAELLERLEKLVLGHP